MKHVLCLMKYYLDPAEGPPFPKFDYQMQALKNLGHRVSFLGLRNGTVCHCVNDKEIAVAHIPLYKVPGLGRLFTFNAIYRATANLMRNGESFDIAYIRMMPAVPPMNRAVGALKKSGCKVVMEIPTYPAEQEEATETRWHRKLFSSLSKRYELAVSKKLDLYTLIGKIKADSYRGIPAINITNGISLDTIPLRTHTPKDDSIRLLAVANIQVMNAFDRIINGIATYRKTRTENDPEIHLHIVGPDRDGTKGKLEQLVLEKDLQDSIHFEGPVFGDRLDQFFNMTDVAVGSLGLHRIGHTGIATLKAREYLAHGIPYITSGTDPIIPQDRGWCLEFPQDDSTIDMQAVLSFVLTCRNNKSMGQEMRAFAKEHLSWEKQFEQVFDALENLAQ